MFSRYPLIVGSLSHVAAVSWAENIPYHPLKSIQRIQNIMFYSCPHCRKKCKSIGGVKQHISKTEACKRKETNDPKPAKKPPKMAEDYLRFELVEAPYHKRRLSTIGWQDTTEHLSKLPRSEDSTTEIDPDDMEINSDGEEYFGDYNPFDPDDSEDEEDLIMVEESPDLSVKDGFDKYLLVNKFKGDFTEEQVSAIHLIRRLRQNRVPLKMYEDVMEWHFDANRRELGKDFKGDCTIVGRKALMKYLMMRYNMWGRMNIIQTITLPSCRAKAKIVTNDTKWCIESLLTDPRITDSYYLFHNDDPFSPPPGDDDCGVIGDVNTGKAYKESYKKYITDPERQVLLPVIFYIDGAATAQFSDLPITALKFTFGIFNRKARSEPHMWRTLGYVPNFSKDRSQEASRGRRMFYESGHVESVQLSSQLAPGEGVIDDNDVVPAQDLHTILGVILQDFVKIQTTGFEWDLMYKGKLYERVEFVPYIHFIKSDTDEADRLAGSYTSRWGGVAQLCRYCCCPTNKSDDPRAKYEAKTVEMISKLVKKNDLEALKGLSQQNINNVWYSLRFGAHNDQGIHGSCPIEMLHALLLGIFKYVRDCFFEQIPSARVKSEINGLAIYYGDKFSRQSDRDKPRTKFSDGIIKGKLSAKEYPGVLLLLATILRSTRGSELLKGMKNSAFAAPNAVADWLSLVETLLMWECWLKSDEMKIFHVLRAQEKHRWIMYFIKKVANRQAGMQLKITKFHTILHYAEDIINFGVPMNFDTGSDESGHKPSKVAASTTQKRKDLFDEQVGQRLAEVHALDLAQQEIKFGRNMWEYRDGHPPISENAEGKKATAGYLQGPNYRVGPSNDGSGQKKFSIISTTINDRQSIELPEDFTQFLVQLGNKTDEYSQSLTVYSMFKSKEGIIYRGTHSFHGNEWRDWVQVNWENLGPQPNKIWGFVDLTILPKDSKVSHGGIKEIEPAIYAIIESGEVKPHKNMPDSELFVPLVLNVGKFHHLKVSSLDFLLVDVETFDGPLVVVPDVGGQANRYLQLNSQEQWRKDFELWLEGENETFPNN